MSACQNNNSTNYIDVLITCHFLETALFYPYLSLTLLFVVMDGLHNKKEIYINSDI